jgi:CDP-2,3-bis-(O-geranylgeranyl)-sn-glycerol synthase
MDPLAILATGLWAMLPAYVPNNVAVLAGGGPPIDRGRAFRGHRLLGDGKTWRGTLAGIGAGLLLALALDAIAADAGGILGVRLPGFPLGAALALPTGAMVGDLAASFLKRRLGRARGSAAPGLDQLDFVVGALLLAALATPAWFGRVFTGPVIAVVIVVTPLLHVGTNVIAYVLGLKDEPW